MPRLPQTKDFDTNFDVTIIKNPEQQAPTNVLILLHGLGDSEVPFANLGKQLNLPHTCVLAIRGSAPLPFDLPGYHWGDDININQGSGSLDPDAGFTRSTDILCKQVIHGALITQCGFRGRDIVLWGFGQGGMLALSLARAAETNAEGGGVIGELGGAITIGGPLPEGISARSESEGKLKTPVLVLGGTNGAITEDQAQRLNKVFGFVQREKWRRSGDGMPRDRNEMMPIMQFLARRLRAAAPDGTVEAA